MRNKFKKLSDWIPGLIIGTGVLILLYPTVSNYLNSKNASRSVDFYEEAVEALSQDQRLEQLDAARSYNEVLYAQNGSNTPQMSEYGEYVAGENYMELLNVSDDGIMGYLMLPKLDEAVAIYHGTDEAVLQTGIGHLANTSLPVGGSSTHAALSGHRGLPSKQLFTDLDQMQIGDVFVIRVLGQTLAYQVDQILTVLPEEMDALAIQEGLDYVTLITCTPYGINTHRLLVRGTRIPDAEAVKEVDAAEKTKVIPQAVKELLIALSVLVLYFTLRWGLKHLKKWR